MGKGRTSCSGNENCIVCFHNVSIINDHEKEVGLVYPKPLGNLVFEDLLKGNFIKIPSMVFKNILKEDLPDYAFPTSPRSCISAS